MHLFLSQRIFKQYDRDQSGNLSAFELRQALSSAGYQLNSRILNVLMQRYGTNEGEITFDDFIACAVRLRCMISTDYKVYKNGNFLSHSFRYVYRERPKENKQGRFHLR
jgi:hypothetical protein